MGKRARQADAIPEIEIIAAGDEVDLADLEDLVAPQAPATVTALIAEVAATVVPGARESGASKFGVEFGVRVRKDGSATVADDPARATYRVFLEWVPR